MHRHPIPCLPKEHIFPDPARGMDEGLLAYGGDLHPDRVLKAYTLGIFPWFNEGDPLLWWSPNPRMLLFPQQMRISKSFRRVLRNKPYRVSFDTDFAKTIKACAEIERKDQQGSWIVDAMQRAYTTLHQRGFAHSIEVYEQDTLIGGLYGISYGAAFFGESMFSYTKEGSKIALFYLHALAVEKGFDYIDCQMPTPHLRRMGAKEVDRQTFLDLLQRSNRKNTLFGSWKDMRIDPNSAGLESLR